MVYKYFIAILFITLTTTNAQDNSNCYNKGAYSALINDLIKKESADSCANYCTSQTEYSCKGFTFDPATNFCKTFKKRPGASGLGPPRRTYCPNCISGLRKNFCGAQGFCKVIKNKNRLCMMSDDRCCAASNFLVVQNLAFMPGKAQSC